MTDLAPMMSSATQDWRTPSVVLDRVRRMGPIAMDPCAFQEPARWFATVNLCPSNGDGLNAIWRGLTFVNSPYGRDTRWFPWEAAAICFWRGRIRFEQDAVPAAPAPFPSCLPYWGTRVDLFRACFGGHVVVR